MSSKDDLDDDYVARLLAEDAKHTSRKYASQGLSALLPKGRGSNVPKPNTRFLSHIVREADQHNASLKRKEEAESEQRLRALQDKDEHPRKKRRPEETANSRRSRLFKDIADAAHSERPKKRRRSTSSDRSGRRHARRSRVEQYEKSADRDSRISHERRRRRRASPTLERRHEASENGRLRSTDYDEPVVRDHRPVSRRGRHHRSTSMESSDPLDDIVGPRPRDDEKVPIRGRGANKKGSGIDAHFAANYDPSQDVSQDSDQRDDEDWDMALEALRDRAKWKHNQTARLRDAGFSEHDISKWERGLLNDDGRLQDDQGVKWSRRGETREWDAGKVVHQATP
ncbi:hypothetical protein H2198_010587 [Neophaeococcomyces mojaviensis]|uniref:Uncharacterized protein n=1 Tax=Neophaeococcomyces mojaviensis TaxID=3383035 RepID=A0ACC2ZR54_9EURO|nr:hypothetical protein H2198_010587 [Knufia sp. JES_112]